MIALRLKGVFMSKKVKNNIKKTKKHTTTRSMSTKRNEHRLISQTESKKTISIDTLQSYLAEISRYKLLTREQESDLGTKYRKTETRRLRAH